VLPEGAVDAATPRVSRMAQGCDGPGEGMFAGVYDGPFDWGSDPLVTYSPTLSRDHVARRKLFPNGFVAINTIDAERLGVRQGWSVRVSSDRGEVTVPAVLDSDIEPGVVCLPYSARDRVGAVLGGRVVAALRVERV
jgi:Molydopterin dinucleotide binding domain